MAESSERWILHADMDAFYASIEQLDKPELRGRPVIVGATSARGVVAAASYEARAYGVHSAMPGFRARQLCPDGVFLASNMRRYAEVSSQVHDIFADFTPELEPIALDEAFLDVTASVGLFGGPVELARRLKQRVRTELQLNVSVGIAPSKLVAKIACTLSKPDGLLVVASREVRAFLDPLPVRRLWGVGPVLNQALQKLGIETIGQLVACDPDKLRQLVGDRAPFLQDLGRGEDLRAVESHRSAKSYGEENTFEHDVVQRDIVTATLTAHAEAVARRLRRDGWQGRTITIKVKLAKRRQRAAAAPQQGPDYPTRTRSKTLTEATSDARRIRQVACQLWDGAGIDEPVRLLGVSVSSLEKASPRQLDLFDRARERDRLGPALDAIERRFGRGAIRHAVDEPLKITPSMKLKRGE